MALRSIPTKWVHTWLKPLYDWLVEAKAAVDGPVVPSGTGGQAPSATGALFWNTASHVLQVGNGTTSQVVGATGATGPTGPTGPTGG